jgi:hypothetical protein
MPSFSRTYYRTGCKCRATACVTAGIAVRISGFQQDCAVDPDEIRAERMVARDPGGPRYIQGRGMQASSVFTPRNAFLASVVRNCLPANDESMCSACAVDHSNLGRWGKPE